jgi:leader peptidase (prepilin peptidase)/N-methyltransferase
MFEVLFASPVLFLSSVGVLGLVIGSFLNVVIHRLPIMLEREWRQECQQFLAIECDEASTTENYNLAVPRSQCPGCCKSLSVLENIPVISYLILRGRCSGCGMGIPFRYPAVEILTALLSVIVAWQFGATTQMVAALILTWGLIVLSIIDFDRQLLPDAITLPLLWLGLVLSVFAVFTDSNASIVGAALGYLSLWMVFQVFRCITGKEGMGFGDFKLLAVLGAWLGWLYLPLIILLSSVVGAVVGLLIILLMGHDRRLPIPFGPYLAAAGWVALIWGDRLNALYLGWINSH